MCYNVTWRTVFLKRSKPPVCCNTFALHNLFVFVVSFACACSLACVCLVIVFIVFACVLYLFDNIGTRCTSFKVIMIGGSLSFFACPYCAAIFVILAASFRLSVDNFPEQPFNYLLVYLSDQIFISSFS